MLFFDYILSTGVFIVDLRMQICLATLDIYIQINEWKVSQNNGVGLLVEP